MFDKNHWTGKIIAKDLIAIFISMDREVGDAGDMLLTPQSFRFTKGAPGGMPKVRKKRNSTDSQYKVHSMVLAESKLSNIPRS